MILIPKNMIKICPKNMTFIVVKTSIYMTYMQVRFGWINSDVINLAIHKNE